MRASVKRYFLVLCKARIHEHRHSIKISKRRHRTGLAFGETIFEFCFASELDGFRSCSCPQERKISSGGGGKYGHGQSVVDLCDHGLRQLLARNVCERRDSLSGVGGRVSDAHVLDVLAIEKFPQLSYWH